MEDNVGRTRQGRASRAHSSARKELAADAPPPKRGRRGKQGPPVRGKHDAEAGGSRSRARRPVHDDDEFDAGQYLNELVDYDEGEQPNVEEPQPQPQPNNEDEEPNVQEESYPGGPRDLSLLKNYHKHRAIPIWDAQLKDPILNKSLCCIVSANKVIKIDKPTQDWFWEYIIASGLEPLVRSNFNVLDYGVLWAFVERWHPETSTFHLPIGEMGITLDDVQCLLHISIQGKFLNHVKISRPDGAQMLSTYLGIDEGDALDMFATLKGSYLTHSYVKGLVKDYLDTAETAFANNAPMHEVRMYRERCVRAFLLFVVGCTIFSNKSSYYLDVVYIQYFADLSSVHEWNWGSAALVHLQNYLDYASQAGSSQLAGYMSLFEEWIITHFPTLSMWQLETNFTENMPLNAKFAPGQGHKDSHGYRQSIDNIQVSDVVFSPYDNRRHVRPLIDGIPRDPDISTPNMNIFEIDRVWVEEMDMRLIDENMREAPEDQPRPPELEVLLDESQERRDPNPLGICRSVRDEVERALDAGEAEPGTPVHGTLRRILNSLTRV
ncbi:hypothetical protein TSUD_366090 [Trifolium subterraneum]|uniref:Aminotransferase-like plant mobile domain-containing protein n=1 Tax=Trifolium subterraneum TaxID=3900 RepID=A0A2Z6P087_TRISU|nr:hypothetical protein TSUD_366090 [Trifolium subterraneum]